MSTKVPYSQSFISQSTCYAFFKMVSYTEILSSNALITTSTTPLRVAVFVGGTSGIGKLTIRALVATGTPIKIYLLGRKPSQSRTLPFIKELHTLNPKAEIIFIEAEVSLLADVKRVCSLISSLESKIGLLFLSAGFAPWGGQRKETAEGHEVAQALEYYSRMLFILRLLPLLDSGRVVSVLGGGMETTYFLDMEDWELKKEGNFTIWRARPQYIGMNTIMLDRLAKENPNVTFIHSLPGAVDTGNVRRGWDGKSILGWAFIRFIEGVNWLVAFSDEESGQRHLFQSTSAAFGGRGVPWSGEAGRATAGGLFLVSNKCDCTPNTKVVDQLRDKGQEKLWGHTMEILGPYL